MKIDGNHHGADQPQWFYEIHVEGLLAEHWSGWLEGLAIHPNPDRTTTISGCLPDQPALFGVLYKIHALNLTLISVIRIP